VKRLVYSPKVEAYVKTDYGVIDISPYITAGGVQRKLDQISSAQFSLRNPDKMWTERHYVDSVTKEHMVGPVFHPMDPIVVVLTRIADRPVQVFTGFLDQTPFVQLFPGVVQLQASCTLKKLMYSYFDPGLPFFNEFLSQYGWRTIEGLGIVNPGGEGKLAKETGVLSDSGFGDLLYGVVNKIGGWPDETIYIEELPKDLIELVTRLFTAGTEEAEEANKEMIELLHEIVGTSSLGGGGLEPTGNLGGSGPPAETAVTAVEVGRAMLTAQFPADRRVLAQGMAVVNVESDFGRFAPMCWEPNEYECVGYWQLQLTHPGVTIEKANTLVPSCELALPLWRKLLLRLVQLGGRRRD
jgi:hypothetical protein